MTFRENRVVHWLWSEQLILTSYSSNLQRVSKTTYGKFKLGELHKQITENRLHERTKNFFYLKCFSRMFLVSIRY